MKRILTIVFMLSFVTVLFADDEKPITYKELPKASRSFIESHFPKLGISLAKVESDLLTKEYEVLFVDGTKVEFDKKGDWTSIDCRFTQVPERVVPQRIMEVVTKRYREARVLKIEKEREIVEVKLSNGLEVSFNRNFEIVDIDE